MGGACRPVIQILTLFQTKKCHFSHRFQTRPLKYIPVFRPGLKAKIMSLLLRLEGKQKNSSNVFRIPIFLIRSYSFGIETIDTFIRFRSSLENHTRFQTKMVKVYSSRFQTKKVQKPIPFGAAHIYL